VEIAGKASERTPFPARFRASGDSRRRNKRPRHRGAAPPDRPGDMNDVTRAQAITGYDFGIARRAAAEVCGIRREGQVRRRNESRRPRRRCREAKDWRRSQWRRRQPS